MRASGGGTIYTYIETEPNVKLQSNSMMKYLSIHPRGCILINKCPLCLPSTM
jgi:hypothetical protein